MKKTKRRQTPLQADQVLIDQIHSAKIVIRPIHDLLPYARNSRKHEDWSVAKIAASIKEFGFTNPILCDDDGTIIAGHARVMAALKLGLEEVPTISLGYMTVAQARAYVIADNQLAVLSDWDRETLRVELEELKLDGFDITLTGFDDVPTAAVEPKDNDNADALPKIKCKPGDVWQLGAHRLRCGDSPKLDDCDDIIENWQKFTDQQAQLLT